MLAAELVKQGPYDIYVKLPEGDDLRKVIKYEERVATVLEQLVYIEGVGSSLTIKGWETGSLWLVLVVSSPMAVGIIGATAWAAAVIWKKTQEARMFSEYANGLKVKTESLRALQDAQRELLKELVAAEAKNIATQTLAGEVPPETLERIKFCINEFSDLIAQGAEIHPALNAPEDVGNLFPDFRKLSLIESRIKLLSEGATGPPVSH